MLVSQSFRAPQMSGIVNIGGIDFQHTPIGLVQKRPTTNADVWRISDAARYHYGQLIMDDKSGECVVTAWGYSGSADHFTGKIRSAVELGGRPIVMGQGRDATHKLTYVCELIPSGARQLVDARFANHPAVNLTWFHGAGIAAYLTDIQDKYIVRQISGEQHEQAVTCNGQFNMKAVMKIAHVNEATNVTAVVIGDDADGRKNPWELIDMYGNVMMWASGINPQNLINGNEDEYDIEDFCRGQYGAISHAYSQPKHPDYTDEGLYSAVSYDELPNDFSEYVGVRFVAEPRNP